jgi:hypothetical protein
MPKSVYMLHNLAHVELNAIDLAWDTGGRGCSGAHACKGGAVALRRASGLAYYNRVWQLRKVYFVAMQLCASVHLGCLASFV